MNINARITIDNDELFSFLETKLDQLHRFQYDSNYNQYLSESLISKISDWDANIKKQKNTPLTIVVCGEFKRGKSSLINAILKEDVVTTNITTETITVNKISYGAHSNELILKNGRKISLSDDELKCDNLKTILEQLSREDKITTLEIKRPLEILKDVTIIDTPGLGDSIKDYTAEVEYALQQADAVIYVFSALYPLSIQEQFFLKTAVKPQKYTNLYLVANSCDLLDEESECERLSDTIVDRLNDILPDEKPVMVSALDERCRQLNEKRPKSSLVPYLENNFDYLRNELETLIVSKRNTVVLDRVQRMFSSMITELDENISVIQEGLKLSKEEVIQKKKQVQDENDKIIEKQEEIFKAIDTKASAFKNKSVSLISELVEKMEADVNSLHAFDIDDIKMYYPVFCIDTLQDALTRCNDYYIQSLYDEFENVSVAVAKKLSMNASDVSTSFKFAINNKTFTKGDKVTAYTSIVGINSGLVSLIAGAMRNSEIKKSAPDVIEDIKQQYLQLKQTVPSAVNNVYSETLENAKKELLEFFKDKNLQLESNLEQIEMISRQDDEHKLNIKRVLDELTAVLESIKNEIEA